MLTVETIIDINDFKKLGSMWNQLLSQSSANNIFLTWEWVFNWWQVYQKNNKLLLLILRDQNAEIVAIAPLYARRKKILESFLVNEIRFIGSGEDVSPDYLDFIIMKGRENDAINAIVVYLHAKNDWDVLNLSDILSTTYTKDILTQAAENLGLKIGISKCAICPYIKIPKTWDEYVSGLSKNMRYNIERRMRNLEKNFKVRYFLWKDIENLEFAMKKLASLHIERWKERSLRYGFSSDESNAFLQAVAKEFACKNWLWLSCIEVDGEIIGMFLDFCYGEKVYYFQGGFKPSFDKYSVGLVLRANIIRKAIEDGLNEIDLLKGAYEHKYRWTNFDRQTINIFIGNRGFASNLFFFDVLRKPQIKAAIKKTMPDFMNRVIKSCRK